MKKVILNTMMSLCCFSCVLLNNTDVKQDTLCENKAILTVLEDEPAVVQKGY